MTGSLSREEYALAIRPLNERERMAPVAYDLNGPSIEIGSAEDNHIVLSGPGVRPYHLAVCRVGLGLYVLVDQSIAKQHRESAWLEERSGDRSYCSEHGRIPRPDSTGYCPLCTERKQPVWLLRPLQAGDVFPIGASFEANVLSQGQANESGEGGIWPDTAWLENPPRPTLSLPDEEARVIVARAYPFDNSNLWAWHPPESPLPVFMHQRVNRHVSRHACDNSEREVGGVLLGNISRDPDEGVLYPVISHAIRARFATEARGHLTFTSETWLQVNNEREQYYPNKRILGWYHTHPGFNIFLSEMDLFIHRNFFRQPWQVALVADPHQDVAGFFVWAGNDVLNPQRPYHLFSLAELDDDLPGGRRPRVRIKLGEPVP